MKTLLSLVTAIAALIVPAHLRAATVPVTVTINSVMNISAGDPFWGKPDFYVNIWIDGASFKSPTRPDSDGFTSPAGWTFTRQVSRAKRGGFAPVRIELRNEDAPLPDPVVDIDPAPACGGGVGSYGCAELTVGIPSQPVDSYGVDVKLNLRDGSWAPVDPLGDSSMGPATPGVSQMACTTGSGNNVANICFTITVGAPSPETLTVSTTADSDRTFCAPGDCSLREAIKFAEGGDTVMLPARTTPYLLGANGDVHLAIRQPLLTVRGPTTGGTAVIHQTWGEFRVFDVHGGAKLVMSHVTVTGGGAGNTSTAFPGHIHGGGIHNHGQIDLAHVTITGNHASDRSDTVGGGGGIYNAKTASARLVNVTIAGNSAATTVDGVPLGGGIAGPGPFTLRNTVIADNSIENVVGTSNCGVGGSVSVAMTIIDEGGNLQFPGADCGRWVTSLRGPAPGTTWRSYFPSASVDPLRPLDPAGVFFPVPAGPAVDTGVAGCSATDQTGRSAPRDGNGDGVAVCDAGAVEAQ